MSKLRREVQNTHETNMILLSTWIKTNIAVMLFNIGFNFLKKPSHNSS